MAAKKSKKKGEKSANMQSFLEETLSPAAGMLKRMTSQVSSSDDKGKESIEVLPTLDHYRSQDKETAITHRPSLGELQSQPKKKRRLQESTSTQSKQNSTGPKFGWIQGVLVRCLLNIFGVMLFIRLSWVTGQAGIGLASVIVLLSTVVTVLTSMSMSAICTNGEVEGGGAYYMISRSLGPEFGGAIGIVFSLANAVAAAMYIVGFAETIVDLLEEEDSLITGNKLNDIRIIGCGTAVILVTIVVVGMEWEAKAQLVLLFILVVAIINFVVGTFIPSTEEKSRKGFVGYSGELFKSNFVPDFRDGEDFFSIFSIFFPAATGILAGANISGNLKNPQTAIPKGTLLAIVITTIVYLLMAWLCGAVLLRDAIGPDVGNYSMTAVNFTYACGPADGCTYGSIHDYGAVGLASGFRPIILAGIFSATLSSALASLVGAPKVFQAVCKDKLFPGISIFAKGYGKGDEPRWGYFLAFVISVAVTCIAELNAIAPIISNFFLMAYVLINFSCFDASIASAPGWRPSFKYYNKWLSLIGAMLCLAVMFVINWWAALVTLSIVAILYKYIQHRNLGVNWGSSMQAHTYQDALKSTLKLMHTDEHVKNFRPQILVLSGDPKTRPGLVHFSSEITRKQSLLVIGHILEGSQSEHLETLTALSPYDWLNDHKIKSFYCPVTAHSFQTGAQILLQSCGLGKLKPNTLLLGYKTDWLTADKNTVQEYCSIIQDAFDLKMGVGIFRIQSGFYTEEWEETETELVGSLLSKLHHQKTKGNDSVDKPLQDGGEEQGGITNLAFTESEQPIAETKSTGFFRRKTNDVTGLSMKDLAQDEDVRISMAEEIPSSFNVKQSGSIDVWWLFDDGGLTLLLPFILSQRSNWDDCELRIFCVGSRLTRNQDHSRMSNLLKKFRIKYSQLTLLTDLGKSPGEESVRWFEDMTAGWRMDKEGTEMDASLAITKQELDDFKKQTHRQLRLRELLIQHTTDESCLIVMTLPMPQKDCMSTGLYMAWLEVLSQGMPPMLLLRGNQKNVLTFYS